MEENKVPATNTQNRLADILDKLTDPIELLITKIASGRFLMAVFTTWSICKISESVILKYPEGAPVIISALFTTWGTMVGFYFGGSMKTKVEEKKPEATV